MGNRVPAQYRLLVGPYRLALWAVLCRFKGRCVNGFVDSFLDSQSKPERFKFTPAHADAIMRARAHFNDVHLAFLDHATQHEELLSQCMKDLVDQTNIDDRANLRTLDPVTASKARVLNLERYLTDTLALWSRLDSKCTSLVEKTSSDELSSFKCELYRAVAQSLWPYYGIVYARHKDVVLPNAKSPYNICSWIPNTDLLSVGFLPYTEVPSVTFPNLDQCKGNEPGLEKLLLYPSIANDSLEHPVLARFLDAASQAPFDFDTPHGVAGHVQVLENPSGADRPYAQLKQVFEHGLGAIESPFTDLFHFVNDVFRCVLPGTGADPTGVLFLATPCIGSLQELLAIGGRNVNDKVAKLVKDSWNEVGGEAFSRILHRDFVELREDLFKAFAIQDKLSAQESIGHSLKSLVGITGWRASRDGLRDALAKLLSLQSDLKNPELLKVTADVEGAYRSLGMFVLPQSMGHFVRLASAAREENWRKLTSWIDEENDGAWDADHIQKVSTCYTRSIFLIAQCICQGYGWKRLLVDCESAAPELRHQQWKDDAKWQDDFFIRLHFPPFKKGSDASYIFTFALIEPICNALTALVEHSAYETQPLTTVDFSLRVKISLLNELNEILVTVENESSDPAPPRIPGLEHTRRMLEDFDLVTFGHEMISVPIGNGLHRISSELRFHPFDLYKKLIAHARR